MKDIVLCSSLKNYTRVQSSERLIIDYEETTGNELRMSLVNHDILFVHFLPAELKWWGFGSLKQDNSTSEKKHACTCIILGHWVQSS